MADTASDNAELGTGGGAPPGPNIVVDPKDLAAYADDIDIDLRDNVRPLLERFRATVLEDSGGYEGGPAFVTSPKYEFAARINRDHYAYAKDMAERLKRVIRGMEVLSDAARRMASDLTTADEQNQIHYIDANRYLGDAYYANQAAHANDPKEPGA